MRTTVSVMAQGSNPYVAEWSPYHGAAYAVIEANCFVWLLLVQMV